MFGHLSKERLWELTEPSQAPSITERKHLGACGSCSGRLLEVREGRTLLEGILCEDAEPPVGHFDSLRDGIRRRIAAEAIEPRRWAAWQLLPAALAVALAVLPLARPTAQVVEDGREARIWSALPDAEDDEGMDLLSAAADEVEGDLAEELGFSPALVAALDDARDDEAVAVAREAFGGLGAAGRL